MYCEIRVAISRGSVIRAVITVKGCKKQGTIIDIGFLLFLFRHLENPKKSRVYTIHYMNANKYSRQAYLFLIYFMNCI